MVRLLCWRTCWRGWGKKHWSNPFGIGSGVDRGSHKVDGWLGGGQIGCDYQTGQWLFGAEGDFSWARLTGDHLNLVGAANILHSKVEWLATATVRVGHVFGAALFYVEGGGAWVRDRHWEGSISRASETRSGWTVGAGVEYAFAPNWSAKLEYNYMDLGEDRIQFSCTACEVDQYDIDQHIHAVKFGVNYRFATGKVPVGKAPAVVTKY